MDSYIDQNIYLEYNHITKSKTITVNFYGCNFNCSFCNVPELKEFKSEKIIDTKIIKEEIDRIKSNAKHILFTGGEPTLQRLVLNSLLRFSKRQELSTALHTNGSKPKIIQELIDNELIDTVAIDIKTYFEKNTFQKTTKSENFFNPVNSIIDSLKKSIEILRDNRDKIKVIVTTPIIPTINFNKETFSEIYHIIEYLRVPWLIFNFNKESDFGKIKNQELLNHEIPLRLEIKSLIDSINTKNLKYKII